jgi:hypothetical protein
VDLEREKKIQLGFLSLLMKFFIGYLCAVGKISGNVKYEVLAVLNIKANDWWDVTPYVLMER